MGLSFLGLEIARRALLASRQAMDVVGHNVANANTPGYSRQRVDLRTTPPFPEVTSLDYRQVGQLGTGVEVAAVNRLRDLFLDRQYRDQASAAGRWGTREQVLSEVEAIFNEPSAISLRAALDRFWNSWAELANNPESLAARQVVLQQGVALVEAFQNVDRQLKALGDNLNAGVETKVSEINVLAERLASLNAQIGAAAGAGLAPNDLLDQRDLALDQLARLVPISVVYGADGRVRVTVDGTPLVEEGQANPLAVAADPGNANQWAVRWRDFNTSLTVSGGELGAYLELRDATVASYRAQVADLAWSIANAVNSVHAAGFDLNGNKVSGPPPKDWQNFFIDPTAGGLPPGLPSTRSQFVLERLAVNPALQADVRRLAASTSGAPGDGSNALAAAALRRQTRADLGNTAPDDFYRATVGRLGTEAAEAKRLKDSQAVLVQQIDNQRQNVSGVNLDEEMVDMIRYQHAFNAAARLVNVMDDMLDTVINRMGLAGR